MMYTLPEMYGAEDNLKTVDMDELALCKEECTPKSQYPCDETVSQPEKGWDAPRDAFSAAELYTLLRIDKPTAKYLRVDNSLCTKEDHWII